MKMLLGALGYDASLENYVGANWSINVAKQALHIGLNKGLEGEFNGIKAVTRQEACLYAFNTLQADLVEYGQRLTTNVNGTEVTLSSGGAKSREWNSQQTRYNTIREDNLVQFAEEYFNLLVKTPDSDKFERPAHTWIYDKKIQIGTWLDKDKLLETYTTDVTGRDLYDLLGSATIRDFDFEVYVDGHIANNTTGTTTTQYNQYKYDGVDEEITAAEMKRSNTDPLGITGDGVLTEVFIDKDKELITITSIHTWLAQATTSYNEAKETASVKVHMFYTKLKNGSLELTSETKTVALDDVPEVANVTTDTFYLVTMSDKDTTKLEVVEMEEPEILEQSTITKFSLGTKFGKGQVDGNKYPTKLTTGGNEYADSDRACYDVDVLDQYDNDLLTTNTYNVYLDKYGYFIGIDLFEGTKQYVFVTGYDMRNSNLSIQTANAAGIFLDGTMQNITVNVKDTNNNIENMVQKKVSTGDNKVLEPNEYANANAYYKKWGTNKSDGVYLLNRWYTYTVTEAGVYTLKPCVDKNGVAMMLASKTDDTTDNDDNGSFLKMNCSKLRLDSVKDSGTGSDGDLLIGETMQYTKGSTTGLDADPVLTSVRAYGEDASVFITVDVDQVSASAGGDITADKLDITKAITDVNGVYTGIQDVDLITKTTNRVQGKYFVNNTDKNTAAPNDGPVATRVNDTHAGDDTNGHWVDSLDTDGKDSYLGENAYAVFDKNHFIIGAVILGEAEGNNATKAYILDPVKYERYENGTYYWQFEAVINGEIVTQEAESKFSSTIDTMRNNQYEVVELRYKGADSEIVTDVKEIARKDTAADTINDKIYGNPFNEIRSDVVPKGHKVDDDESIYDVVLTGASADPTVTFKGVTRPRGSDGTNGTENIVGHTAPGKTFTTTALGTLRLQGRTLYVLEGQNDYGIDFVRDAKAVVRQREGFYTDATKLIEDPSTSWENRQYGSVQEAIDSLGDPDITTGEKEFRGIITAVLNGQGVAEWIVFYSDTLAETKNNTSVSGATIDVEIRTQLPGGKAEFYEIRKVARPTDGTDIAEIKAPDLSKKGFAPVRNPMYLMWKKYNERPVITFEYILTGSGSQTPGGAGAPTVEATGNILNVKANTNSGIDQVVYSAAWAWLNNNGYLVTNGTNDGTKWTFIASKAGTSYVFTTNLTSISKIYVNDVEGWYAEGDTIDNPAAATYAAFAAKQTSWPISDSSGPSGAASKGTGDVTVAFATHNGKYIYTDLYKANVGGADNWYRNGSAIALTGGSHYKVDAGNFEPIPDGGLKMAPALSGKTIATAWKVVVTGVTNPEYVANTGATTTFSSKLAASKTYRAEDGTYVTTSAGSEITNVTSDITITDTTTTYDSVTMPGTKVNGKGLACVVTDAGKVSYKKGGDTFTLTVTLSGTSSDTTAITFVASGATATNATLVATSGATTDVAAVVSGTDTLTITPVANKDLTGVTYSVEFTVTGGSAVAFT